MVMFPIGIEALLNRHRCGFFTLLNITGSWMFLNHPRG